MKRLMHVLLLLFTGLNLINSSIHAELLIVKHDNKGFSPLTLKELQDLKCEEKLGDLLDKYQWPMCITSELDEKEQKQLLTAGEKFANAEERFIEQQINAALGSSLQCGVIFIPTTLYELFCIKQGFGAGDAPTSSVYLTTMQKALNFNDSKSLSKASTPNANAWFSWPIDLTDILNREKAPAAQIWEAIFATYRNINTNVLIRDSRFYINQALAEWLFKNNVQLGKVQSSAQLSDSIQKGSEALARALLKDITSLSSSEYYDIYKEASTDQRVEAVKRMPAFIANLQADTIIPKYMLLEYAARAQNQALIVRGTSWESFKVGLKKDAKDIELAGNTLFKQELTTHCGGKETNLYAISLSNSLFSGLYIDPTACTYCFLNGTRVGGEAKGSNGIGYAILIDKMAYKQHRCNRLLFISPLATLPAMAQHGEYFHDRTTTAIAKKEDTKYVITGLKYKSIKDPTGVLLITRDPVQHAKLFSQFLADNGRFFQSGTSSFADDATFTKTTQAAQHEAAQSYGKVAKTLKTVRKAGAAIQKKVDAYEAKKAAKRGELSPREQKELIAAFEKECEKQQPDTAALEKIIIRGIDPNATVGQPPLVYSLLEIAIKKDLVETVQSLIKHGANVNMATGINRRSSAMCRAIKHYDYAFNTEPTTEAAQHKKKIQLDALTKIIQILVEHGANINTPLVERGQIPLQDAISSNLVDVVKILLSTKNAYYTQADADLCNSDEMSKLLQDNSTRKRATED